MAHIATDRLLLRPIELSDAPQVHTGMASDFDVVRHTGTWPWPADMAETERRCVRGFDTFGWMVACVGDQVIGTVGMGPEGDFGYMLPQSTWGQGYATEMGRAFVNHVFGAGIRSDLKACVYDDNPASARVLQKLGFTEGPACIGRCEARDGDFPIRTFTLQASAPVLRTARLTLRPVAEQDIDAITRVVSDYEVSKWLAPVPHPYMRADAETFVREVGMRKHGTVWAMELEGVCIGLVGVDPVLGYWLDPMHWGQGYMSEAVAAAVDYWFTHTECDVIPCSYFKGNAASARIQENLGFEELGDSTSHSLARGSDVPSRETRLTRERWSALRHTRD